MRSLVALLFFFDGGVIVADDACGKLTGAVRGFLPCGGLRRGSRGVSLGDGVKRGVHIAVQPGEITAQSDELIRREPCGEGILRTAPVGDEIGDNPVGFWGEHDAFESGVAGDRFADDQPLVLHAGQHA